MRIDITDPNWISIIITIISIIIASTYGITKFFIFRNSGQVIVESEISIPEALEVSMYMSDLFAHYMTIRMLNLQFSNVNRVKSGREKLPYSGSNMSRDRKHIDRYISNALGRAYSNIYLDKTIFLFADILYASLANSDTLQILIDESNIAIQNHLSSGRNIDVDAAIQHMKNVFSRIFENAISNPQLTIIKSNPYNSYFKQKYHI